MEERRRKRDGSPGRLRGAWPKDVMMRDQSGSKAKADSAKAAVLCCAGAAGAKCKVQGSRQAVSGLAPVSALSSRLYLGRLCAAKSSEKGSTVLCWGCCLGQRATIQAAGRDEATYTKVQNYFILCIYDSNEHSKFYVHLLRLHLWRPAVDCAAVIRKI
jgi:hypothetical protein